MQDEKLLCHKCACSLSKGQEVVHPVRSGYLKKYFPLFHYQRVPLCSDCLARQKKIDVFDRVVAVLALGIVFFFLFSWFLLYF